MNKIFASLLLSLIGQLACVSQTLASGFEQATTLSESELYLAQRQGRFLLISLKTPHQVLSTSAYNGGQSTQIKYLVNHQSMEAKADDKHFLEQISLTKAQYHQKVTKQLALASEEVALMGTAANIQQLAKVERSFNGLTVTTFVTAGVKGNAQRSGDETRWYQTLVNDKVVNRSVKPLLEQQGEKTLDNSGTINIIVLINKPISPGAQNKVAMLATEAKSAALAELAVASKVSSHLATGTGTDQLIIASPVNTDMAALPSASGHLKLGELVGSSVKDAVLEALKWQNKLAPAATSNVLYALARFGLTRTILLSELKKKLSDDNYQLAKHNFNALISDARLTASAFAYAQLLDRLQYQTIPADIAPEILRDQAAQVSVALSAKAIMWPSFWQQLSLIDYSVAPVTTEQQPYIISKEMQLFIHALALGWENKWLE